MYMIVLNVFFDSNCLAREPWCTEEEEGSVLGADQETGAGGGDRDPPVGETRVLERSKVTEEGKEGTKGLN